MLPQATLSARRHMPLSTKAQPLPRWKVSHIPDSQRPRVDVKQWGDHALSTPFKARGINSNSTAVVASTLATHSPCLRVKTSVVLWLPRIFSSPLLAAVFSAAFCEDADIAQVHWVMPAMGAHNKSPDEPSGRQRRLYSTVSDAAQAHQARRSHRPHIHQLDARCAFHVQFHHFFAHLRMGALRVSSALLWLGSMCFLRFVHRRKS